ncbi:MAG: hypothetical protein LBP74_06300 [Treponema sp.]|jgi:glycine cleavage system aminomethyltransferase T|nr:hypothetical protein [Treponema sp.]
MNKDIFNNQFKHSPFIPYDPTVNPIYTGYTTHPAAGGVQPFVYTNWRDEELSWHENCYIHAGLNPFVETRISGPDAAKFLSECLTNDYKKFPIGKIKHAIAVSEKGYLMIDGIIIRTGENEFDGTNLSPYLDYRAQLCNYDVRVEDITGEAFVFQLGGPRSLEIVEAATKDNFHDLKFLWCKTSSIGEREVRIQRIGMAGSLAYEVRGVFKDSIPVYQALLEAGKPYAITRLGRHAYWNTHTENGFPQAFIHFPYALETDDKYWKYMVDDNTTGVFIQVLAFAASKTKLTGSLGSELESRFVNPFELGWGGSVSFDHDFTGKKALMELKENHRRKVVTLEWNTEDILDIYRSEFEPGTPYTTIEGPEDYDPSGHYEYCADKVLVNGKYIGTSTGRIHSWYYRKMISLGLLEKEYCNLGQELVILWGDPNTRQKEIRATVARYPYMNINRNENVDVSKIPTLTKK